MARQLASLLPDLEVASYDSLRFADALPSVLTMIAQTMFEPEDNPSGQSVHTEPVFVLIRQYASEAPSVAAISPLLAAPITTREQFYLTWVVVDKIVGTLHLTDMRPYRPALATLAAMDNSIAPPGIGLWGVTSSASDMMRFMDDPSIVWAPQHKNDFMAERSLAERVSCADEMRPHVPELLQWLADVNWPPYRGCERQLARFPEATIEALQQYMSPNSNDLEWVCHMVEFAERHIPLGPLWEKLRPQMESLVNDEATDEETVDLSEAARRWLGTLDKWRSN